MNNGTVKTFDEFQSLWAVAPAAPTDVGSVHAICIRQGNDAHASVPGCELCVEGGLIGDRWRDGDVAPRHSQITLIRAVVSNLLTHDGKAGYESGDNFVVDLDLSEANLPVGGRLRLGAALIEVTPEPHMGCKKFSARFGPSALKFVNWKDHRGLRLRGLHAEVIEPGAVRVGDAVTILR